MINLLQRKERWYTPFVRMSRHSCLPSLSPARSLPMATESEALLVEDACLMVIKALDLEDMSRMFPWDHCSARCWNLATRERMPEAEAFVRSRNMTPVLQVFQDPFKLIRAREIQYQRTWKGKTDYIDSVDNRDVCLGMSRGKDIHGRYFVVLRNPETTVTLFQRYSDNPDVWTCGSKYNVPFTGNRLHDETTCLEIHNWYHTAAALSPR